jgi:uncharacterized protein
MEFCAIPVSDGTTPQKYILYRPMLGIAFVGNQAMVDLARAALAGPVERPGQGEIYNFLRQVGFLNPDPPTPVTLSEPYRPSTAVLLLTNQCQLCCVYCYAGAGDLAPQELSFAVGKTVIDRVAQYAQEDKLPEFGISFHGGGEPTRAWKVIKQFTEYARQKPITANITLTSNGLWSKSQTEWILANLNGVSLSIDGGPETQDRQRPLRSGGPSSRLALRAVAALDQHKFPFGIRMTATAPWSNLPKDVRFLCEETGCNALQVEPAFNTGRSGHGRPGEEDSAEFMEAVLECYDIAEKAGRKFFYAGARIGWVSDVFCNAPYNALVVNPYGDIVACYEVTDRSHPLIDISTFGKVENGEVFVDNAARLNLHRLMAERRAGCQDCFCYWSCAGNCYTRTFITEADGTHLHQVRDNLCEMSRKLTEKLLLRRIAAGGGIWQPDAKQGQVVSYDQVDTLA